MNIDFDQFQSSLDDIGEEQTAINEYKLLRARDVLIVAQRNLRNLAIELDALLINYMRANACDIAISDTERLYVGTTKVTKSHDDQGILMAIMEAGNGNLELLTTGDGGMLASQPWKHGAVRALIGDAKFAQCFTTETKLDVKTGKPAKSIKVADSRFGPKE